VHTSITFSAISWGVVCLEDKNQDWFISKTNVYLIALKIDLALKFAIQKISQICCSIVL
jgi:hypothetical protein